MRKTGNKITTNYRLYTEAQDLILDSKYREAVSLLYKRQMAEWPMLKSGTDALSSVKKNKFFFNGYEIYTQYNPRRINSTTADISSEAIKKRQCFLCSQNLPDEQRGIIYRDKYVVLCNPFPIFRQHMTITNLEHKPQRIKKVFRYMLKLGKDLPDYCFMYNGPESGASAPDHQHFQACKKDALPVIDDYEGLKNEYGEKLRKDDLSVYAVSDGLRRMFFLESESVQALVKCFNSYYGLYAEISKSQVEPMMNIISIYQKESGWRMIIFLRGKHRPDAYFQEGNDNITVSPATIDLGGVMITPFEKDFKKIDKNILSQIYKEVSIGKEGFDYLKTKLKK
jgi:hypothetical protein